MRIKLYTLLTLLFLFCFVSTSKAQNFAFATTQSFTVAASSPGNNVVNSGLQYWQLVWTGSGTRTTCTVAADTSVDGVSWNAGALISGQACTSDGASTYVNIVGSNYVRITVTALSGAGNTANIILMGWIRNPAGSSAGGSVTSVSGTANQVAVASGTTTPVLSTPANFLPPGTIDTQTVYATSQAGADWVAKVNACLAALPTKGTCDARGLNSTQTSSSATTIAIGAGQTLLLGYGTYSSSGNPVFTVDADSALRGMSKTSTLVSATTSGATIMSVVGGTAHNNISISGLTFSNSNSNGTGFDITGMQRSEIRDIRFQQIATGINCNSQSVNTLYDNFYGVLVSPAAGGTGYSIRGICNALHFYGSTAIGGANHLVIGNTGDAINPNQDSFDGFDSESATTAGVDIERGGQGITIDGSSRFEGDAIAVFVNPACTNIYGIVVRDSYFSSSNTTNVSNSCAGVTIDEPGQAPNIRYTDGLTLGLGLNLLPSVQNFTGTNTLIGWQSFNSTSFPSGTAITKVTTPLVTGTLHANAVELGDGAAAFSGFMTSAKVNVDANYPYTISFWASADANSTTFRPVLLLYNSAGSLITTGTGTNTSYTVAGNPTTGSLGYNKTGYACNCFATGGDQTVTTANTYQRYTITVRLPATAFQAQFGLAVNNTNHLYVDEFSVTPGSSPAPTFLSTDSLYAPYQRYGYAIANWCGGTIGATNATTYFLAPNRGGGTVSCLNNTSSNNAGTIAPAAGTAINLYVKVRVAGATAGSGVVTFYKNGSATALTCTLGTALICNDTTHTIAIAAGDFIAVGVLTGQASDTIGDVTASYLVAQ